MLALGVSNPSSPQMPELNSAMPLFSPILTIAVQSGVPSIWTNFLTYKEEQHEWYLTSPHKPPLPRFWLNSNGYFWWIGIYTIRQSWLHKSLNGLAPEYMHDMFKYITDVNVRSTRNADKKQTVPLRWKKNPEKVHR